MLDQEIMLWDRIEKAEKEVEKLREALEQIALSDPYGPTYPGNVARKALKEDK